MPVCKNNCSTSTSSARHACPRNGIEYRSVSSTTVLHHLRQPWQHTLSANHYYYCNDPLCPVVYFGDDDSIIEQTRLRTRIGHKDPSSEALVCYCFGVTRTEARDTSVRAFVTEQTRAGTCACQTRNPSAAAWRIFPNTDTSPTHRNPHPNPDHRH